MPVFWLASDDHDLAEIDHITVLDKDSRLEDIRCAMLQAIDKKALIDLTGGGILTPANGPFSPGQEGFMEDNGSLPYDPAAAKAAIAIPIVRRIVCPPWHPVLSAGARCRLILVESGSYSSGPSAPQAW